MLSELEKQLNDLTQKAFAEYNWDFEPFFPNVLVRVFDYQESTYGSNSLIIKPQTAQAPNFFAIVVRVGKPKHKDSDMQETSELQPGDIIRIPYYAGIPTFNQALDEAGYRIVPEAKFADFKKGRIISSGATQETPHIFYKCGLFNQREAVRQLIDDICIQLDDGFVEEDSPLQNKIVNKILADYDIVPKRKSLVESFRLT